MSNIPRDYGYEAHQAAKKRLSQIEDAYDYEEYGPSDEAGRQAPQYPADMEAPWDGCEDCMIREILTAAWPILQQAARDELAEKDD